LRADVRLRTTQLNRAVGLVQLAWRRLPSAHRQLRESVGAGQRRVVDQPLGMLVDDLLPASASSTLHYMSSEAVRIESETLNALRERSAESGEPIVRLAQRYINEGMRLDRHPGIFFRDGRAGRRAVVIGGPDVWEVIAAARSAPERGERLVRALAERVGTPVEKIRSAVRYYGEFPDEVDRFISANEQEAERLARALENERRLLG